MGTEQQAAGPEVAPDPVPGPDGRGAPVGRRLVLGTVGLGALGLVLAPRLPSGLDAVLGAAVGKDPTGLTGLLPGGGGFRYYSVASSVPERGPSDYRLTVDGLVERPATCTLDALRALPQTRIVRDVPCVTGRRVPATPFTGVPLFRLLDAAGIRPEARAIRFTCFDGTYTESLTLPQARREDVMVALNMQDKPLSHAPGGPIRLYAAPTYVDKQASYKSAKWLSGITLTRDVQSGYWEELGPGSPRPNTTPG